MKDSLTSILLIRKKDKLTCLVNSSLNTLHWNLVSPYISSEQFDNNNNTFYHLSK